MEIITIEQALERELRRSRRRRSSSSLSRGKAASSSRRPGISRARGSSATAMGRCSWPAKCRPGSAGRAGCSGWTTRAWSRTSWPWPGHSAAAWRRSERASRPTGSGGGPIAAVTPACSTTRRSWERARLHRCIGRSIGFPGVCPALNLRNSRPCSPSAARRGARANTRCYPRRYMGTGWHSSTWTGSGPHAWT